VENVFICNYIRHSLIFPRCCLIVHHGGIGTTGQALKAGVPQIVIPFLGDQFDNAERLCRLGIALKITVKNIVINDLAKKMHIILNDLSYQLRAQKLSKEINHENGAKKAAQYISVKIKS
jgi:UDP:flavonoid glycosyltransferase YjiC (YdhE family)